MVRTANHIECIADPEFKASGSWTIGTPTSGAADVGSTTTEKLTLAAYHAGVITAGMGFTITFETGNLYLWEIWVDSVTLGGGTLTVTAGGKTLKAITAAGKFSGSITATDATALKITTATAAVAAVLSKVTLVRYGDIGGFSNGS